MATKHRISSDAIRLEIARLQWANALMRAANKALAKGDKAALNDMLLDRTRRRIGGEWWFPINVDPQQHAGDHPFAVDW